jgi:hypothetical protein
MRKCLSGFAALGLLVCATGAMGVEKDKEAKIPADAPKLSLSVEAEGNLDTFVINVISDRAKSPYPLLMSAKLYRDGKLFYDGGMRTLHVWPEWKIANEYYNISLGPKNLRKLQRGDEIRVVVYAKVSKPAVKAASTVALLASPTGPLLAVTAAAPVDTVELCTLNFRVTQNFQPVDPYLSKKK